MPKRELADGVNANMLRWARERAGYSVEDVAKKLSGSKPDRVHAWERGEELVPLGRLDRLADIYKRPTALFYLDEPPDEEEHVVPDFRSGLVGRTPEIRYQIRRAHEREAIALELLAETRTRVRRFEFSCKAKEDAAAVGRRLRQFLGIDLATQQSWNKTDSSGFLALNGWRDAIESVGVIVTQASKRELSDARGMSVYSERIPVVVLTPETANGRIFTLIHEVVHLGLREGGICDLHDDGVEWFCNRVAGETFMPERNVRTDAKRLGVDAHGTNIRQLARLYSVSEWAMTFRLWTIHVISKSLYDARAADFARQGQNARESEEKKKGGPPQHRLAIAGNGRRFTSLVLDAYHRGTLSAHRAATCLDVSARWMPDIEQNMIRYAIKGVEEKD